MQYIPRLEGEDEETYVRRLAQEVDDKFLRVRPRQVAALVEETVSGSVSA